ncbi:hypothetical protein DPEC_G00338720 [Dallia pectoralis]|uniref:Uncharacterized protein n=1 Tax=Dallia pectoralis TaxID=75939 RepID=A0ACC2F4N7_DALPE|nr:hypothetical protein DPEC_G00338720 [Dallia pectoralis]
MDECANVNEPFPDLTDLEAKIGQKTPEGLLNWMRGEASAHRGDAKQKSPLETKDREITGRNKSLDEKIRKLKADMAHLRSVDVKILQQLLAVHEGIDACKWLLEERGPLTSRCSSLTSSQYSLWEGPGGDASRRSSWGSLHDPLNDKLDNISVGSYLDTLADDMDEYCPSSSESVLCSAPLGSETPNRTRGGSGTGSGSGIGGGTGAGRVTAAGDEPGTGGEVVLGQCSSHVKPEVPKEEFLVCIKATEAAKATTITKDFRRMQLPSKSNGVLGKAVRQTGGPADTARACLAEKLGKSQSLKLKPHANGKIDLDGCKLNGKMHLEYDAHWRWVQSQDDVTFL